MDENQIFELISKELESARKKWPMFVDDVIHAVGIVNEESGESMQAALDVVYDNGSIENLKKELIQTAAMCVRVMQNIGSMKLHKHHSTEDIWKR